MNTILLALALTVRAQDIPALPVASELAPASALYCTPVAYRDYEVLVGRAARVRPLPGCKVGSLIRKVSLFSGREDPPIYIPLPDVRQPLDVVWLFGSKLQYTLDGTAWKGLALR